MLRARRILVPLLAWTLAAGNHEAIDAVYILLIALSVAAGVYWTGRCMMLNGYSPAFGLLFFAVPAVLIGIDTMTVDVVFAALVACFAWQIQSGNRRWLWLTVSVAPLVRETGLILVAACFLIEAKDRNWKRAAAWTLAGIPIIVWSTYLQTIFPTTATTSGAILPWWYFPRLRPGILLAFITPADYPNLSATVENVVQLLDRVCLAGIAAAAVLAVQRLRRAKWNETALALGAFAAIVPALTNRGVWLSAYGYSRPISPLFLLLMIRSGGSGRALAAAVIVSLMVDLRVSAEVLTQALGVLRWFGLS